MASASKKQLTYINHLASLKGIDLSQDLTGLDSREASRLITALKNDDFDELKEILGQGNQTGASADDNDELSRRLNSYLGARFGMAFNLCHRHFCDAHGLIPDASLDAFIDAVKANFRLASRIWDEIVEDLIKHQ